MKTMCIRAKVMAAVLAVLGTATSFGQTPVNREEPGIPPDPRLEPGQIAPILEGLGDHTHPVTTKSARAQQFFDQGLNLAYGFNHREATRAFQEAARLDPDMAMAYWGIALVNGPNLNMPMDEEGGRAAYAAVQKALELKSKASQAEQDYIDAMAKRYAANPEAERAPLDQAYADAMEALVAKYPDDLDLLTLYGDAVMNLSPWNYWTHDGHPRPNTPKFVSIFEKVLARDPQHPGALHYYCHAVEASNEPERALAAADNLLPLMPGAGHMVHMPSHIYLRLGMYDKANASNEAAINADEGYITQCRAQGIYPLAYYPHNIHFLWSSSSSQANSGKAIPAAEKVAKQLPKEALQGDPSFESFAVTPYFAYVRFGQWDKILAMETPDEDLKYTRGVHHYARGLAFVAMDNSKSARKELQALNALLEGGEFRGLVLTLTPPEILIIAAKVLEGELLASQEKYDKAIAILDAAVRIQDSHQYNEPPNWHLPVRHNLGAVLFAAGRPAEAETVYWEDLRRNRENIWALTGVLQALKAQPGKEYLAAEVQERLNAAKKFADIEVTGSRF